MVASMVGGVVLPSKPALVMQNFQWKKAFQVVLQEFGVNRLQLQVGQHRAFVAAATRGFIVCLIVMERFKSSIILLSAFNLKVPPKFKMYTLLKFTTHLHRVLKFPLKVQKICSRSCSNNLAFFVFFFWQLSSQYLWHIVPTNKLLSGPFAILQLNEQQQIICSWNPILQAKRYAFCCTAKPVACKRFHIAKNQSLNAIKVALFSIFRDLNFTR